VLAAKPLKNGGAEGSRTPDLRNAIAALSQLSYGPEAPSLSRPGLVWNGEKVMNE
jgi:hypothetical protein